MIQRMLCFVVGFFFLVVYDFPFTEDTEEFVYVIIRPRH